MTKSELIKRISARHPNMLVKDVQLIVDTIFSEISGALSSDKRVELRGFGAFTVRVRKAREARNPRTSAVVSLAERRTLYFRAGKELNVRLNQGKS